MQRPTNEPSDDVVATKAAESGGALQVPEDSEFSRVLGMLNPFQRDVFDECARRRKAGLSLPLGSGKTIISLLLGLHFARGSGSAILVVVSKTLLQGWVREIRKFFGSSLKYQVYHTDAVDNMGAWSVDAEARVVLTTPDVIGRAFRKLELQPHSIEQRFVNNTGVYENFYRVPSEPFLKHTVGEGVLFSLRWGCMIVDEIQRYTNVDTARCRGIGAVCSPVRWGLSGTMFEEPKIEKIMGFCYILDLDGEPRTLPDMKWRVYRDRGYKGLGRHLVVRDTNEDFVPPEVREHTVGHELRDEERIVYETLKRVLVNVAKQARRAQMYDDPSELRMLNSNKLTLLLYMRETLVCPMLPIASVALSACDASHRNSLGPAIMQELADAGVGEWLRDEDSACSSRMREILARIRNHAGEHVIVYGCFASFLAIFEHYLRRDVAGSGPPARGVFRMTSGMSAEKRGKLLDEFGASGNGVLLLSYDLGAEGLNLQFASVIMLADFWWNAAKIQQAIGRIFRFGQIRDAIDVYFFTSNTGVENILFRKQRAKLDIIGEFLTGNITTRVPTVSMDELIRLIALSDNKKLMGSIDYY